METKSALINDQIHVPGTFVVLRNTTITPNNGLISNVNEPNVGSQGDGIFTSFNWYAAVSTNNGSSVSYVSPFSTFPSSPSAFSAGFCCDQRVAQDSSRNLVFWYMQYLKTGSTSTSTNGVRLALAHGQAGLGANAWTYYDFTPSLLGLPAGTWLDSPHLQTSANYLYFTTNVFNAAGDSYYGALIVRLSLAQLDSGAPLTLNVFTVVGSYGSIMPVNGAGAEGTRPGRTTMYLGAVYSTTSIRVLTWPESSTSPTVDAVSGLATTFNSFFTCSGPDGLDPCTRGNVRMQTGWITNTELGLMWNSSQDDEEISRPYPFIRTVLLNPTTLAVLAQPDIFSSISASLYPAMSVNERGHLGGTVDFLGGERFPTIVALIRDDLSPDPATSGWEAYGIAASNFGTPGRYGDYNGAMPHEKYPKTWLAVGHRQVGGSANANSVTHNYWFGRERDNPAPTACTSFAISLPGANPTAAGGSQTIMVAGSPGGCVSSWSATGNGSWLTVSPAGSTGSDFVTISWAQNTSPSSRSASATIAGRSFLVNQAGAPPVCSSFSINPTGANPSSAGGSESVTITGSPSGCLGGNWSAAGNGSWITVSESGGTGSGTVTVFWAANGIPESRSGSATIAGNSFAVNQAAGAGPTLPKAPADFDGDGISDWVVYRNGTWLYFGPCLHPLNEIGAVLNPACSRCVATICAADSYCCATGWDSICAGEVSLCQ
ncbi:MAG: BACON domain-containing carbohydrate-binding protein [Acidobacteriota bacterium]